MNDNTTYDLLMSDIYLGLTDNNTITTEQVTQYKKIVTAVQGYTGKIEDYVPHLLRIIESYMEKSRKTMDKGVLLQHCTDILNTINSNICSISMGFLLKKYEYMLCNERTPMADRIIILKACIDESTAEGIDDRIECRANLLNIYLSSPNEHIEDIRALSAELKSLIELRSADKI